MASERGNQSKIQPMDTRDTRAHGVDRLRCEANVAWTGILALLGHRVFLG
jgi:hypothetical protein